MNLCRLCKRFHKIVWVGRQCSFTARAWPFSDSGSTGFSGVGQLYIDNEVLGKMRSVITKMTDTTCSEEGLGDLKCFIHKMIKMFLSWNPNIDLSIRFDSAKIGQAMFGQEIFLIIICSQSNKTVLSGRIFAWNK